jgi:hypothetical protein
MCDPPSNLPLTHIVYEKMSQDREDGLGTVGTHTLIEDVVTPVRTAISAVSVVPEWRLKIIKAEKRTQGN